MTDSSTSQAHINLYPGQGCPAEPKMYVSIEGWEKQHRYRRVVGSCDIDGHDLNQSVNEVVTQSTGHLRQSLTHSSFTNTPSPTHSHGITLSPEHSLHSLTRIIILSLTSCAKEPRVSVSQLVSLPTANSLVRQLVNHYVKKRRQITESIHPFFCVHLIINSPPHLLIHPYSFIHQPVH